MYDEFIKEVFDKHCIINGLKNNKRNFNKFINNKKEEKKNIKEVEEDV